MPVQTAPSTNPVEAVFVTCHHGLPARMTRIIPIGTGVGKRHSYAQ
jgi:hypothetical protein